jgi:MSHA pilin protein MshC
MVSRIERSAGRLAPAGFSLVELVVVLIVAGILAVVATAKFADRKAFDTEGFYDDVQAAVRYAQKQAIAKRRNVCVAFTSSSASLTFAVTAGSGVSLSPVPATLTFSALGRPNAGVVITISGNNTRTFTVEAETGYVHS